MGTTLTGTTPQDTYDSLIKVTDNGPLSGSLKTLTDGLGNDSALALSTGAASITGTLAVSSTSTLSTTLVAGASTAGFITPLTVRNPSTNAASSVKIGLDAGNTIWGEIGASYNSNDPYMAFFVRSGSEKVRITDTGNVGIGTSSPAEKLSVAGAIITTGGITGHGANRVSVSQEGANGAFIQSYGANTSTVGAFTFRQASSDFSVTQIPLAITSAGVLDLAQGQIKFPATQVPSADPNTLDDYEEGTWTMGIAFGGASTGITYFLNSGTYTKVGRMVTVNGILSLTSKGSATGNATLTGLPFTIGTGFTYYSAPAVTASTITSTGSIQGRGGSASTIINLEQHDPVTGANAALTNANFANNSDITVSFTYFV